MENLSITLPVALKAFVEEQVAAGKYRNAGAYLAALVRADRKRKAEEKLLALIQEAEDSGPATPMTRKDWEDLKRRVWERHAQSKGSSHGKSHQKKRRRAGSR
jgi:putative addiction module CopG family antidote